MSPTLPTKEFQDQEIPKRLVKCTKNRKEKEAKWPDKCGMMWRYANKKIQLKVCDLNKPSNTIFQRFFMILKYHTNLKDVGAEFSTLSWTLLLQSNKSAQNKSSCFQSWELCSGFILLAKVCLWFQQQTVMTLLHSSVTNGEIKVSPTWQFSTLQTVNL